MLSLPWGLAGTVPKGWATGGSAGGLWSLGIAEVCPHLVQAQAGLIPCCHQPMQCQWVLGTCGSSAACVSMPGSPTEMGISVPGSPTEMGTSVATTCPPLSCSAQWHHHCAPAAGHSQSCSRPGSIPHFSTQHPCVASSTARLGPGGDIRVQEGWGGPHDLEP